MPSIKKKTFLAFDLFLNMIFTIKLINALLANMDKIFLITNINYVSAKISFLIYLVSSLSLFLILIQYLSSQ